MSPKPSDVPAAPAPPPNRPLPPAEPLVAVTFEESECIMRAGSTTTTYLALVDRVWTAVRRIPHAVVRSDAPTPGVVWRRVVQVPLRVGTPIERIVESPSRDPRVKVSSVLFGRSRGLARHRRTTRLIVDDKGQLRAVLPST